MMMGIKWEVLVLIVPSSVYIDQWLVCRQLLERRGRFRANEVCASALKASATRLG